MTIPRKQESKAARFHVSLPKTLLDRIRRYPDVNWSAVAQRSFLETLLELETGKRKP